MTFEIGHLIVHSGQSLYCAFSLSIHNISFFASVYSALCNSIQYSEHLSSFIHRIHMKWEITKMKDCIVALVVRLLPLALSSIVPASLLTHSISFFLPIFLFRKLSLSLLFCFFFLLNLLPCRKFHFGKEEENHPASFTRFTEHNWQPLCETMCHHIWAIASLFQLSLH